MPIIRPGRSADAAEIARLTLQLGYDAAITDIANRLSSILSQRDQALFVADGEAHLLGWMHLKVSDYLEAERFVEIAGLVVDSAARRQGVGRVLIEAAEHWTRQVGCCVIRLRSTASRHAAHQFYERMGFTNVKTQYSFAKALDGRAGFSSFVPRVDPP